MKQNRATDLPLELAPSYQTSLICGSKTREQKFCCATYFSATNRWCRRGSFAPGACCRSVLGEQAPSCVPALTGGAFDRLNWHIVGHLTEIFQKRQMPGGLPGGGEWGVLELTGTLTEPSLSFMSSTSYQTRDSRNCTSTFAVRRPILLVSVSHDYTEKELDYYHYDIYSNSECAYLFQPVSQRHIGKGYIQQ